MSLRGAYFNEESDTIVLPGADGSDLYAFFEQTGFHFPSSVLTSYVLSLLTKPFVILTGISGTGKTKIAQIFARYVAGDESNSANRWAFVPVRPDWTDNRGMLGFYNLLTQKYQGTELLTLLLRARAEGEAATQEGRVPRPYFVVLDEMNLAKVEHYFSDFLSCLESRVAEKGEPLILHDEAEDLTVTASDGELLAVPRKLPIPPNVYFTGTVNVDETTYMFSPKVLDRANVIEFNHVDLAGYLRGTSPATGADGIQFMDPDVRGLLGGNQEASRSDYEAFGKLWEAQHGVASDPIETLHSILEPYHMHFGYRVVNEMSRFVRLGAEHVGARELVAMIDFQVLQKIIPKLHGTAQKLTAPLTRLFRFCEDLGQHGPDDEAAIRAIPPDSLRRFKLPRSAEKLQRMLQILNDERYVSAIQ